MDRRELRQIVKWTFVFVAFLLGCWVSNIAPRVMIITGGHQIDTEGMHIGGAGLSQSVAVGDGCWLCAGALILPGVTIPQKVVVAAGAVVTQSFSEGKSLWAGMPAQVKKSFCGDISSKEG